MAKTAGWCALISKIKCTHRALVTITRENVTKKHTQYNRDIMNPAVPGITKDILQPGECYLQLIYWNTMSTLRFTAATITVWQGSLNFLKKSGPFGQLTISLGIIDVLPDKHGAQPSQCSSYEFVFCCTAAVFSGLFIFPCHCFARKSLILAFSGRKRLGLLNIKLRRKSELFWALALIVIYVLRPNEVWKLYLFY